jgi:uncharacterized protein (DUF1697 family)
VALTTQIALLRGVNVGGRNLTSMADLRRVLAELGFASPRTLLQSGNLVFEGELSGAGLEDLLQREFQARLGLDATAIARTIDEWRDVLAANPHQEMAARDPSHLLVTALKSAPNADAVRALEAWDQGPEKVVARGRHIYIAYPAGVGTSRLTNALIERRLGVAGTARNWTTALKLAAMADA